MSAFDIIVIVLTAVAFVGVVAYLIRRKAKGKGGCDCGCSDCPHCAACGKKDGEKK